MGSDNNEEEPLSRGLCRGPCQDWNREPWVTIRAFSFIGFWVGGYLICCALCVWFLMGIHRIQNTEELQLLVNNYRLPAQGRCKVINATHSRCLPQVFVIGASKCGTTSIVDYMKYMNGSFHFVERFMTDVKMDNQSEIHRFDRKSAEHHCGKVWPE